MINLINRIVSKLSRLWFTVQYRSIFQSLGEKAFLFRPFRLDGSENILIGMKTVFQRGVWLYCKSNNKDPVSLKIGKECVFGYNNHISTVNKMVIGNHVLTANNVYISDNIHEYEDISQPIINQPIRFKKEVSIGDGCWIGENVCIIGARIGKNCVIGANAVVTHDIPDYSVAVGIPAKIIRQFDSRLNKWVKKPKMI